MTKTGKLGTRLGIFSAIVAGTVSLTTATPASAAAVNGGWYPSGTACYQAGSNAVDRPDERYRDYLCTYSASHNPHWHLTLYTT
ncbi:hypothetical protein OG559_00280 [Micromonospora sp. NBC_01405]|uniref:hypothetical protein n=1 Tax=Micromonospora sp. NBC_01405 TaxID=2903589 RepID=UPI0032443F5D